jgi:hypothetical protein
LSNKVYCEWLHKVESMILWFYSSMIYKDSCITDDSTHCTGAMTIDFNELFWLCRLHQFWSLLLFDSENNTFIGSNSDWSTSMLYY